MHTSFGRDAQSDGIARTARIWTRLERFKILTPRSPVSTAETTEDPSIVWRPVICKHRVFGSPQAIALVLGTADGTPLPMCVPGQYVWIAATMPTSEQHILQYSLWTAPQPGEWRMTVKLVGGNIDTGLAHEATDFVHYHISDGDRLEMGFPFYYLAVSD